MPPPGTPGIRMLRLCKPSDVSEFRRVQGQHYVEPYARRPESVQCSVLSLSRAAPLPPVRHGVSPSSKTLLFAASRIADPGSISLKFRHAMKGSPGLQACSVSQGIMGEQETETSTQCSSAELVRPIRAPVLQVCHRIPEHSTVVSYEFGLGWRMAGKVTISSSWGA